MKMTHKITYLLVFFLVTLTSFSQEIVNGSIMHDDVEREYILYVPASYSGDVAAPLVFNFHGYTSNASEQMLYGDFRSIADTAGFLVVHPMGTPDTSGQPHWNVGFGGTDVDDLGFTSALLDSLLLDYNINEERVYSTGMSNGGFMSYYLACHLSERIAAIASVTGTMTTEMINGCMANHPMPVMEIHGTADYTVPYNGMEWMESIPNVLDHWVNFNNCNLTPTVTDVPDINTTDGSTVEHYLYSNGDNGVVVEHYKVIGGGHTWPGTAFNMGGTNYDIDASLKIWQFFAQYDINGSLNGTSTRDMALRSIRVYPNPASTHVHVEIENAGSQSCQILNIQGRVVRKEQFSSSKFTLDLQDFPQGMYFLRIGNETIKVVKQN